MNRKFIVTAFVTAALGVLPLVSSAQQVIKRMNCADFFLAAPVSHVNFSATNKVITIQIIRDSCRPRGDAGNFVLQLLGPDADNHFFGTRYKGYTRSQTVPFAPGATARVQFTAGLTKASGTFDYTVQID